ncbi:hypothetical protein MNEG_15719 [Monoraphidium neglectum]|uniref:Uncharacterized protein n=1 Tax=Monoraphidium neglectum TaxID=145388 RepID=A0A0D2LJU1_9CHLO|nr:hypothetical protein MNEG_15719 [Monoraphidium neglectum]KIY92244.1 hypothetical protein MNEG_15719 [Monoraphidium neglectum]|eukprot:XP_013891264.1 hypothetical protein MNEG_15719 [Monoraphidium neglectum]
MAGGVAAVAGLPFAPAPFDPHSYWTQKHFGGGAATSLQTAPMPGGTARAAAAAAAAPPQGPVSAPELRGYGGGPASLPSPSCAAGGAGFGGGGAPSGFTMSLSGPAAAPVLRLPVVHWWQDPKAVFGDGPGLLDPNQLCDDVAISGGPSLPRSRARSGSGAGGAGAKRRAAAHGGDGAGSDTSCHEAGGRRGAAGPPGRMLPPDGAPASAATAAAAAAAGAEAAGAGAGAGRGSAFKPVERRASPKRHNSRVWSSRPSKIESVDSDGNDSSMLRARKRKRHHHHHHSAASAGGEASQRTDGSAFASAAAGILMSLSSGG